jgi:peptidoglycan hydrolase CwlO-like protein
MSSITTDRYAGLKLPPVSPGVTPERELERIDELEAATLPDALAERIAALEERERTVARAAMALESQRDQLVAVRAEYEARREALDRRGAELVHESLTLRAAQAEVEAARASLERRARELAERESTLAEHRRGSALVEREPRTPERSPAPSDNTPDDTEWWRQQLGHPDEAA